MKQVKTLHDKMFLFSHTQHNQLLRVKKKKIILKLLFYEHLTFKFK